MYKLLCVTIISMMVIGDVKSYKISREGEIMKSSPTILETRSKRSINGHPVKIKEVPWHVELSYEDVVTHMAYRCSGSIISNDFVLTAASCFCNNTSRNIVAKNVTVRSGDDYYPNTTVHGVKNIVCHPNFTKYGETSKDSVAAVHNIALVQLNETLTIKNVRRRPVLYNGFPIADIYTNGSIFMSSWGYNDPDGPIIQSNYLQGVKMEITSIERCKKVLKKYNATEDMMKGFFCVEPKDRGFPCSGNLGSPAIMNGVQVGFGSWSYDEDNDNGTLGCYVSDSKKNNVIVAQIDVGYYLRWITRNIIRLTLNQILSKNLGL